MWLALMEFWRLKVTEEQGKLLESASPKEAPCDYGLPATSAERHRASRDTKRGRMLHDRRIMHLRACIWQDPCNYEKSPFYILAAVTSSGAEHQA